MRIPQASRRRTVFPFAIPAHTLARLAPSSPLGASHHVGNMPQKRFGPEPPVTSQNRIQPSLSNYHSKDAPLRLHLQPLHGSRIVFLVVPRGFLPARVVQRGDHDKLLEVNVRGSGFIAWSREGTWQTLSPDFTSLRRASQPAGEIMSSLE